MVTYQITRFIHSVIRSNKLVHLVDALLEKSHQDEDILDDLISQFKRFLQKGNDEIFEQNRLKYVTFLDDFNIHLADIKNLGKQDNIQINSLLLEVYEIPKKRNNLLSALLLYFYLKNHRHLQGKVIFKVIYLYFLIITYRNRLGENLRANIIAIDDKRLHPLSVLFTNALHRLQRKHRLPTSRSLLMIGGLLCVTLLGIASWKYDFAPLALRADVIATIQNTWTANNSTLSNIAVGALALGSITDKLQWLDFQNILIIALLAVIFQSLRTGFTNLFVNSFLTKTFAVIGSALKMLFHAVFAVYNYVIYKLSTRYLFTAIDSIVSRGILPGPVLLSLFLIGYFLIYIAIISVYFFLIAIAFTLNLAWGYIISIVLAITFFLIGMNMHADIANFRAFLIEIESIFKNIHEAEKTDAKKAV